MSEPPGTGWRLELTALTALLAAYALLLWTYFVPVLGSPDANCYQVSARLLAETGAIHQRSADPLAFVSNLWLLTPDGDYYPKYPPFYPALAAAFELVFGRSAGLYVTPVSAWLAVLCTYLVARLLLPGWAAVVAAGCLATGPVFNSMAVDQIAHAPSVAALTASFALFLWSARGRGRLAGFAASGLLLGFAAGVRYTDVLLALPALAWFATHRGASRAAELRRAAAWGLGLSLPCLILAWYHWQAFGSPWRTAYSLTDEQSAFALERFGRNLRLYVPALFERAFGPLLAFSVLGFGLVLRRSPREAFFYAAWTVPLALLYCTYYYAPEHHALSYVRFLLPLQLPAILLALTMLVHLAGRIENPRRRLALIAVLVLVQGFWGVQHSVRELELRYGFNDMVARRVAFARETLPEDSTAFMTRWLLDDLDYHADHGEERHLFENDLLDQGRLTREVERFLEKRSIQRERVERLRALLVDVSPGEYQRSIRERIDRSISQGRPVFVVGAPQVHAAFQAGFGASYVTEQVAALPALEPRHRMMALRRDVSLVSNPAWSESSIVRIRARH